MPAKNLQGIEFRLCEKSKVISHKGFRAWQFGQLIVTGIRYPYGDRALSHFSFSFDIGHSILDLDLPWEGGLNASYSESPGKPPVLSDLLKYLDEKGIQYVMSNDENYDSSPAEVLNLSFDF